MNTVDLPKVIFTYLGRSLYLSLSSTTFTVSDHSIYSLGATGSSFQHLCRYGSPYAYQKSNVLRLDYYSATLPDLTYLPYIPISQATTPQPVSTTNHHVVHATNRRPSEQPYKKILPPNSSFPVVTLASGQKVPTGTAGTLLYNIRAYDTSFPPHHHQA